jgi:hypothetical protein
VGGVSAALQLSRFTQRSGSRKRSITAPGRGTTW